MMNKIKKAYSVTLPQEIALQVEEEAKENYCSQASIIRRIVVEHYKSKEE